MMHPEIEKRTAIYDWYSQKAVLPYWTQVSRTDTIRRLYIRYYNIISRLDLQGSTCCGLDPVLPQVGSISVCKI